MKKRKVAKFLTAAFLVVLMCAIATFSAIAADVGNAASEANLTTEYGTVPEEHANKTFVAFSENVCIGASDVFSGKNGVDGSNLSILSIARNHMWNNTPESDGSFSESAKAVQIVMLKDYTASANEYYDNIAQVKGFLTVDLNGNTFNSTTNMFRVHAKAYTFETTVTIKSGNIILGNKPLMRFGNYGKVDGKKFSMIYENINFSLKSGSTLTSLSAAYHKQCNVTSFFDITYTDCMFDIRNATNHITLFEANDPLTDYSVPHTFNYVVNSCVIKANSPDGFTIFGAFNSNSKYSSDNLTTDYAIYEENFDGVNERVDLENGNNLFGAAKGWVYAKKSTNGEAYIENGRLYLSGNKYDIIYRDGGHVWGNYTLEADFCYTDATEASGWGGMLYNVQSDTKFQKAGITPAGKYSLNGKNGSKWSNDVSGINKGFDPLDSSVNFSIGNPFRMKVTVHNKTAALYYAMLDESGAMKTDFIHLVTINNIPADAQTGSIGFLTSTGSGKFVSFWVDNIKCYSESLVSYSENFDSYGDLTLEADTNNTAMGIYFEKSNTLTSGGAEIKDGALHLSGGGKNFNAVFFNMGKNWTNYALESDLTYVSEDNNVGWAGLLFRATDIDNFWKGAINIPTDSSKGKGSLNSQLGGDWYKNTQNSATYQSGPLNYGETIRLRIVVNEKVASLYCARYTDGTLGAWEHVFTTVSEDKFAEAHMTGTVGIIVGGSTDSKEKHIYVDNITVSRLPGADRTYKAPNGANIYEPTTGIVNPPVVVEKLTSTLPATDGERAAVVITEIDESLNILAENGTPLTTVESFIDTYRTVLIPAFVVDSEAEADALAALLLKKDLSDSYVVATAENAALVKRVRLANDTTKLMSGALIFGDLNTNEAMQKARALVVDNMSYVAISLAPISEDTAFYFAARQVAAWGFAESTADVYRGIANGYHGILSENVSVIYDVYESITEPTVSGETVVIAHRGANTGADIDYPENTLIGIRAAKEIWGADAIEIDFGLTKDGYVVIMHDTTVDRTTNGTGNVSNFTLAEIKALTVDYVPGKETTVPTLEEVLILAKEIDVVLYCHVKEKTDANIAAFSYLVEKYDCQDRVLLFNSSYDTYNSNVNRIYSGTGYELSDQPVLIDGIQFTSGDQKILSGCESYLEGVIEMKKTLNKHNYQPLFYPYLNQGDMWSADTFYYQLSARGFVNTHSVTDGQAKMDKLALTESGAVGWLTNNPHLSDDYHYALDLSGEKLTLVLGETIDLSKTLKLTMGTANAECGLIQVGGKTLVSTSDGYTLNEAGKATVVYYATRTTDGGTTYRVYSEPIELTFVPESLASFTPKSSITLGSELVYNVYVPAVDYLKSFTIDDKTYENLEPITLDDGNQYYKISIPLYSSEAARTIVLKATVTINHQDHSGTWTMSIPKYAKRVIESNANEEEVALVKDVLSYIRAAYAYFNTEDVDQLALIDAILGENYDENNAPALNGSAEKPTTGVSSATYILNATPTIRFHITGEADSYAFYVDDIKLKTVVGTDENGTYLEMDVYAYAMCKTITYTIDGVESGSYHINCYYTFVTTDTAHKDNAELINLVARFAKYCESASAYRNSVLENS